MTKEIDVYGTEVKFLNEEIERLRAMIGYAREASNLALKYLDVDHPDFDRDYEALIAIKKLLEDK